MRKFFLVAVLAIFAFSVTSSVAEATIHPIVASFCAKVALTNEKVLDPPGQTPAGPPATWDQSDLRALQATGFLTVTALPGGGFSFAIDPTVPAVKSGDFPAFGRCPNYFPAP